MSKLTITREAFTGMVAIRLEDELTTQALILTPAEYNQLLLTMASCPPDRLNDPVAAKESANLKHLTIYNGHSLPTIIRARFEAGQQMVGPTFHFELHQLTRENGQITDRVIATL